MTVVCAPSSGSPFSVGTTTVTCTATDLIKQATSCTFPVTVVGASLGVTKFIAFGDSITDGEVPDPSDTPTRRIHPLVVRRDLAYPAQLQALLSQRYPLQTFSVINAGLSGEKATGANTLSRLDTVLTANKADVLFLQEGINDLDATDSASSIAPTIQALRVMIRDAKGRGMRVIVGTLLPQIPGLVRADAPDLIVPFNTQLVAMALSEGALVTDLYATFITDTTDWISPLDGLHPTPAGYQEMAFLFANTLKANFEVPPIVSPVIFVNNRPRSGGTR